MSVAAWPVWLSAARRRVVGAAGRPGTGVGRKIGALRSPWAAVRPALHVAIARYSAAVDGRATIVALTDFAPQKKVRNYENSISRRLETTRSGAPVSSRTRSRGTPGASSRRTKPSGSTVRQARSVTMSRTQAGAVSGEGDPRATL